MKNKKTLWILLGSLAVVLLCCSVAGGYFLLVVLPEAQRIAPGISRDIEQQLDLPEFGKLGIPVSPDLLFDKAERHPEGGFLPETAVVPPVVWLPAWMSFPDYEKAWRSQWGVAPFDVLSASEYTIFQFYLKAREATLANPSAATPEAVLNDVVDFYITSLPKNGWIFVDYTPHSVVRNMKYAEESQYNDYITGKSMHPLLFQKADSPNVFLLIDEKRSYIRMAQNNYVYWITLYTNPKVTELLPSAK